MAERIIFDGSLYAPEAVAAAAAAYADFAVIEVTAKGGSVEAALSDTGEYEPQTIARAFSNHVLHETIARRRQAALEDV